MYNSSPEEASSCVGENLTRNVFLIVCVKINIYLWINVQHHDVDTGFGHCQRNNILCLSCVSFQHFYIYVNTNLATICKYVVLATLTQVYCKMNTKGDREVTQKYCSYTFSEFAADITSHHICFLIT